MLQGCSIFFCVILQNNVTIYMNLVFETILIMSSIQLPKTGLLAPALPVSFESTTISIGSSMCIDLNRFLTSPSSSTATPRAFCCLLAFYRIMSILSEITKLNFKTLMTTSKWYLTVVSNIITLVKRSASPTLDSNNVYSSLTPSHYLGAPLRSSSIITWGRRSCSCIPSSSSIWALECLDG